MSVKKRRDADRDAEQGALCKALRMTPNEVRRTAWDIAVGAVDISTAWIQALLRLSPPTVSKRGARSKKGD